MIARLIDWCLDNRLVVLMLTACLIGAGTWATVNITVDAIPDLSDVQVVIRTEHPGQAPQIVEDQVTYPITTAMLAVPGTKAVRGYSMFGSSFVYIIFDDGTDLYWARARVLEQLATLADRLPPDADPQLGPDATGVGWVYQYALTTGPYSPDHPQGLWRDPETNQWYATPAAADDPHIRRRLEHHRTFPGRSTCPLTGQALVQPNIDLAELRSLQDWHLRYELTAVDGVSEVASLGGFVKQYQVVVDPVRLRAYDITLEQVNQAVAAANRDVGGGVIEMAETEYMVRSRGYLGTADPAPPSADAPAPADDAAMPLLADRRSRTSRVLDQLRQTSLGSTDAGVPITLDDVADIRTGPDDRRGMLEWNGRGEAAGGIVVMRFGENARDTITRVQHRLDELERSLPPGVNIVAGYDRADLIDRSVATLRHTLVKEMIAVAVVVILFLLHVRSALVALVVLPTGALASLLAMHLMGINANIMSLGGIAIAIGVMIDSSIVLVENAHVRLKALPDAQQHDPRARFEAMRHAAREVGPALFFSLLVITVSFLPVFLLGEQSGRMFKPLAYTKTFAMAAAAVLAVTVTPVLMTYFVRDRVVSQRLRRAWRWALYAAAIIAPAALLAVVPLGELDAWRTWLVVGWAALAAVAVLPQPIVSDERNPLTRLLEAIYQPIFAVSLKLWPVTLAIIISVVLLTLYPMSRLGSEFMPPLEEGDLLYMPTTVEPGVSVTKARELLQQTDKLIMQFPEVAAVYGKVGRAETATDPAPMNMIETTITLHRDTRHWRTRPVERFYTHWPDWAAAPLRRLLPEQRTITLDELIYGYTTADGTTYRGLNDVTQLPGLANSWTQPIRTRIDMLSTGVRTDLGIKVLGPDLATLTSITDDITRLLKSNPTTAPYTASAYGDQMLGGKYIDIHPDRDAIARYDGLTVDDVQHTVANAVAGRTIANTVEGLARYPINLRYPAELRDNLDALRQTLVATPDGVHLPLDQVASLHIAPGPPMIKSENARPTSWVYVDIANLDVGSYVQRAQQLIDEQLNLPEGYSIVWSGQYEYMQATRAKLMIAVPLTLAAIVLLLYLATRSWLRVGLIVVTLSFSVAGAIWFIWLLDYNYSIAVVVGIIALLGIDAETSLIMLLYLDNSYDRAVQRNRMRHPDDLWQAVHEGAVKRMRPKTMTVMTTIVGLAPLMFATGAGADTMSRLAAPMIGGLTTSFIADLILYPLIYYLARRTQMQWQTSSPPKPE